MIKAILTKEVCVDTSNDMGTAAKLSQLVSKQAKANIRAAWAASDVHGKGHFSLITDNNQNVINALKKDYPGVKEHEVLVLDVPDTLGEIADVTFQLSQAGVDIDYLFTTYYEKHPAIVLSTRNNKKAMEVFSH